jgi:hypothetical protein
MRGCVLRVHSASPRRPPRAAQPAAVRRDERHEEEKPLSDCAGDECLRSSHRAASLCLAPLCQVAALVALVGLVVTSSGVSAQAPGPGPAAGPACTIEPGTFYSANKAQCTAAKCKDNQGEFPSYNTAPGTAKCPAGQGCCPLFGAAAAAAGPSALRQQRLAQADALKAQRAAAGGKKTAPKPAAAVRLRRSRLVRLRLFASSVSLRSPLVGTSSPSTR